MDNTKIIKCSCLDNQQDKLYGISKRLGNKFGKPPKGYRCTVCGREHTEGVKIKK